MILRPSDCENLADQQTGREHLSHTRLSAFLNCERKYELGHVDRLELLARPKPLTMGHAFHRSIELNDPEAGANELRAEAVVSSQQDEDRLRVDEATIVSAAALYLAQWPAPADEQRELEFKVRLRNPWSGHYSRTFDLLGKADGVTDLGTHLDLSEIKFTGNIDVQRVRRLKLDRQVSLECYGLWRATGKFVREVNYRFVRKPSIRQRQKESVDEFCVRLAQDYVERPDFYSHGETLYRDTEDLLRIEGELWEWADQMRRAKTRDLWTRNTSQCHEFGGCAFIPICSGEPDAMALYREREPRPQEEIAA